MLLQLGTINCSRAYTSDAILDRVPLAEPSGLSDHLCVPHGALASPLLRTTTQHSVTPLHMQTATDASLLNRDEIILRFRCAASINCRLPKLSDNDLFVR
jgi:hypothetical protein